MSKDNEVNGAGFVKKNRMANQEETNAIVKAFEAMGIENAEDYGFHLYGRYDAPYGWYIFGVSSFVGGGKFEDGQMEKYLILGDCLDVLPDYRELLTLADVVRFAWDCDKDGAYDAIQDWGVFKSITYKMSSMLNEHDIRVEGECAVRKGNEWKLLWDIWFNTESGGQGLVQILIPACLGSREEADEAFASEWKRYTETVSVEAFATTEREAHEDIDFSEAMTLVEEEEKRDEIVRINKLLQGFVKFGLVEIEKEQKQDKDMVWVLTIRHEGEVCPEVHKTFNGAIEGVRTDFFTNDDVTEDDWDMVRENLEAHLYFYHEDYATEYDLTECPVCK